ncbi:MAG: methyltransferase domain-containing protein [Acidimicrobiia bacterium]|nr:methyltransferase domain-containing protein [Acidimicrobiia bacterium]
MFRTSSGIDDLARYERHGLRSTQLDLAEMTHEGMRPDATLLEVGGGVGALHVDLLERGAASATTIDLSPGWDEAASTLLGDRDLTSRVIRVQGDFVVEADDLDEADIVLLHRVICCYPDWPAMVDAAASLASESVVFTIPTDSVLARISLGLFHAWLRVRRCGFTSYIHPVDDILARFAAHGLTVESERRRFGWASYRLDRR